MEERIILVIFRAVPCYLSYLGMYELKNGMAPRKSIGEKCWWVERTIQSKPPECDHPVFGVVFCYLCYPKVTLLKAKVHLG